MGLDGTPPLLRPALDRLLRYLVPHYDHPSDAKSFFILFYFYFLTATALYILYILYMYVYGGANVDIINTPTQYRLYMYSTCICTYSIWLLRIYISYTVYSSYATYIQYCTTQSYRVATIHTVVYCNILYSRCWFHLLPNIIKTKQWLIAWLIDRLTDAWWHDFPSYSLHSTAGGARCRNDKIPERHIEETAFWTLCHWEGSHDISRHDREHQQEQ